MPRSVASVFSNAEDFRAALSKDGFCSLVVTSQGGFRERLTQVALNHMRLAAGEEELSRIAFVAVPADTVATPARGFEAIAPLPAGRHQCGRNALASACRR